MLTHFTKWMAAVAVVAIAGVAGASKVEYTYYFTAADLLRNEFVNGADGSTAADNGLFDGATLIREGSNGNHANAARTYVASQHANFNSRWDALSATHRLTDFNLWGFDGRGVFWGEDYKPFSWVDATTPDGWETNLIQWPWGTPPTGYLTDDFPRFWATSWDDSIALEAAIGSPAYDNWLTSLEDLRFSVTIEFDPTDAFWGQNTQGAPNTLGSDITMWWGGWLDEENAADTGYATSHLIEGNFTAVVPVPPAAGLILLGMAGFGLRRKFMKK